ncbi:DegV family protein [Ruminococcus sp.]|uniref:DegV family protein n=1 Tax=Ruminococcus sp. TaxID=41978 RepID=UPI0025E0B30A|nr:DegV family protein [Ruminococcus sp.]MBQ8966747.1 DegV family protein [Ruminococcus sp.]
MNRPYTLFCDSTCDLPEERLSKMDCRILPLTFEIDGKSFTTETISMQEFYRRMREDAVTKTSQVAVGVCEDAFEEEIKKGRDVLYLAFSSGLSGTYNSALVARDNLLEKYPEAKISVVDSLAASSGEGLLLIYAEQKKREGMTIDELTSWIEVNRFHICHVFTVDDLKYLFRGGRVSRAAALAGTVLGIKPVLNVDNDGHLIPQGKIRGRRQSINKLGEMIRERKGNNLNAIVTMSHGDCIEDARYAEKMMKEIFGEDTEVVIAYTGPVIGAHSGPGTLALFFWGDYR